MTADDYAKELKHYIRHLQRELKALQNGSTPALEPITDRAVVRHLERVKGVDMGRLRAEILPDERRGLLNAGPGTIKSDGFDLICSRGVVVTVI